jgi:pimeloyl-ACP methyl ester carboxylesterase
MKRNSKGLVALILCLAMLAALPLSAGAVTVSQDPIIYIADMEDIALYEYPDKLDQKPVFDRNSGSFRSACMKILLALMMSDDNGASGALPDVVSGINAIFSPIACNASGKPKNASVGPLSYTLPISQYPNDPVNTAVVTAISRAAADKVDANHFYVFYYDWRLDPTENAASLLSFIERVITDTRAQSVSLIGAGYGGVIANAYLYRYRTHAAQNVSSCLFLNSPLQGNALIGDLMKGKVAKKAEDNNSISATWNTVSGEERGDAMLRYMNDDPDNFLKSLIDDLFGTSLGGQILGVFAKYLTLDILKSEGTMKDKAKLYNNFALLAGDAVYNQCLREYLRTMPGLWALVPTKDYKAAYEFLYGDEILNYEFTKRLENARAVTDNTVATLKYAQADGIRMYVVANYGRQILPATISLDDLSDGVESTKYASAGAVTAECGRDWQFQINCAQSAFHNHRAPDNDIEASTCALPENTWFIKDLKHLDFQYDTTAAFVAWLVTSATQRNVWENATYPQYLIYSKYRKNIAPYSSNGGSTGKDSILGDTDLDGVITPADARMVLRYAVELEIPTKTMRTVADVDGNGYVQPADARLVLRYAVGIISNFPADRY